MIVYYLLESGKTIKAEKECTCITHDIPHWLHMDSIWKRQNRKLLEDINPIGFAFEEMHRLNEKIWQMKKRHIEEVIYREK